MHLAFFSGAAESSPVCSEPENEHLAITTIVQT